MASRDIASIAPLAYRVNSDAVSSIKVSDAARFDAINILYEELRRKQNHIIIPRWAAEVIYAALEHKIPPSI